MTRHLTNFLTPSSALSTQVEFFVFLRSIGRDALNKRKDLLEMPVMTPAGAAAGVKYAPPKEGLFVCEVMDGFVLKDVYRNIRYRYTLPTPLSLRYKY